MPIKRYFGSAAELMKVHRPHMTDGSILLRMKRIGLEPGKSFDLDKLPSDLKKAVAEGAKESLGAMQAFATSTRNARNGWVSPTASVGVYGNEYLFRTVIAMIGLGANPAEDATYPNNVADAFWSLTMYDGDGFPVPNAIKPYAIGDCDDLKFNPDGSLDLYIQPESAGKDKESNWLRSAKSGALGMTMRLYAPRPAALNGEWNPLVAKRVQ